MKKIGIYSSFETHFSLVLLHFTNIKIFYIVNDNVAFNEYLAVDFSQKIIILTFKPLFLQQSGVGQHRCWQTSTTQSVIIMVLAHLQLNGVGDGRHGTGSCPTEDCQGSRYLEEWGSRALAWSKSACNLIVTFIRRLDILLGLEVKIEKYDHWTQKIKWVHWKNHAPLAHCSC